MIFGELPLDEAEGAILAAAVTTAQGLLRKGVALGPEAIAALRAAGVRRVMAARLEPGDVGEDAAALRIARALAGPHLGVGEAAAGRVNLHALRDGLFDPDAASVNAINARDERVSVATLAAFARVEAGRMVATVKIIPFAVPEALVGALEKDAPRPALTLRAFAGMRLGLVQTRLASTREAVLERTAELMAEKAQRLGGTLAGETRVAHEVEALAKAVQAMAERCDVVVIFSASAVADAADLAPRAIALAGGQVLRVGMPVDPGNLLVLGRLGEKPVVVAPGSARGARRNSLDPMLERLMAGLPLTAADLAGMGVGGLLL